MTELPTEQELNEMKLSDLQEAALIFEKELGKDVDRGARKADLLEQLIGLLPNDDDEMPEPTPEVEEEIPAEPEVVEEPVEEKKAEEIPEPESEPEPEPEPQIEPEPEPEPEVVEEPIVEEPETVEKEEEDLYYCEKDFNDWESGWTYTASSKIEKPKPIDKMTPGLEKAIEEGIVKKK